jgi:hypothetical protein
MDCFVATASRHDIDRQCFAQRQNGDKLSAKAK